jgi:hypothetical protein
MQILSDKVFVLENFLSPETCDFLVKSFSNNLIEAPEWTNGSGDYSGGASKGFWKEGVFTGPSYGYKHRQIELSATNKIIPYNGDNDLSKDLLTGVGLLQEKSVANIFKKDIHLDHMLYCHMVPGAKNELHWDNWLDIQVEDHSGLLYLTDDYEGGLLQFPDQDISLKPKKGTFICFKGDSDLPHEVTEITSGNRINLITFYSIRT